MKFKHRIIRNIKSFLTVYLFSFSFFLTAQVYVDSEVLGLNDGSSLTYAYVDLQSALSEEETTEIRITGGDYKPGLRDPNTYFEMEAAHSLYCGFNSGDMSIDDRILLDNPTNWYNFKNVY